MTAPLCKTCIKQYTAETIHNPITDTDEPMCRSCRQYFDERVGIKEDSGISERPAVLQAWYEGGK
jgi:hypothetical protein